MFPKDQPLSKFKMRSERFKENNSSALAYFALVNLYSPKINSNRDLLLSKFVKFLEELEVLHQVLTLLFMPFL